MARIVELKQYDNVLLGQGVMQNWADLDVDGPSWRPVVADLLDEVTGHALVVGPLAPSLLDELAQQCDQLTLVVRAAPDAGSIAERQPSLDVRAGNLLDVVRAGESFDAVIMLDDISRVLSAESDDRTWVELANSLLALAKPGVPVVVGVENERGLHRTSGQIDAFAANFDRDWTPFRTWDASRPRTTAQLQRWIASTGRDAIVWGLYPAWVRVDAMTQVSSTTPALRDAAAAYALRGHASPLPVRSAALADLMDEVAGGWVVVFGGAPSAELRTASADGSVRTWRADDETLVAQDGTTRRLPAAGRTLMIELIAMAADYDTPGMRRLLRAWRESIDAATTDGVVAASHADARLAGVYLDDGEIAVLEPATANAPYEDVVWGALADLLSTLQGHGLKHPWPTAMNRMTRLASLGAMAGVSRPDDLQRWLRQVKDEGQTREELLAVVKRQQDELKSVWARWKWDEKQYAAFVAKSNVKKGVRYAKHHGKNLPKVAGKRAVAEAKKKIK